MSTATLTPPPQTRTSAPGPVGPTGGRRWSRLWRGPAGEPHWARPALLALLLATGVLWHRGWLGIAAGRPRRG